MPIPQTELRRYRVSENRRIADGTFELVLTSEDPAQALTPFQAGQWVYLYLLNPDGSHWARAAYSIASAPSSGTQTVVLGIKTAGDFTQRAEKLAVGDVVLLQGPWGVFTLKKDQPRVALFAGGIGVTPLLSMVREAAALDLKNELVFFYSFRVLAETPYLDELRAFAAANRIQLVLACTGPTPDGWEGERGRINDELIARMLPQHADDFVLCGPDPFMDDLKALLVARGIDPKKVRRESFG